MKTKINHYIAIRCLEILIGIYFLLGALPKGMDIDKFAVQIAAYKVIVSPHLLFYAALFTLFVEVALGIALITGLRLKGLTIVVMQTMLIFFATLITYAWINYGLEDCGCFPFFKMSPQISLIKNAILIISGLYILWVIYRVYPTKNADWRRVCIQSAAKLLIALILGGASVAYAYKDVNWDAFKPASDDTDTVDFSQFVLFLPEGYFNLGEDIYLVAIMSMSCDECRGNVPYLNDLLMLPELPPMVALCYEDHPGDMDVFRGYTQAAFPMYSLGNQAMLYYSMIGKDSFRLSLVRNGKAMKSWDGHVPEYEAILDAINALPDL